jgi:hypothetical protein
LPYHRYSSPSLNGCSTAQPSPRWAVLFLAVLFLTGLLSGCVTQRVIVAPVGAPVILTKSIENPSVLTLQDGEWLQGEADEIPAGWACWYPHEDDFE